MNSPISKLVPNILQSQTISSISEWSKLIKGLIQNKVLTFSQQRIVSPQTLKFPITAQQAQTIIIKSKSHPDMLSIVLKIKNLKTMLKDITFMVQQWKKHGLTKQQEIELQETMKHIKQKIQVILNQLQTFLNQTKSIDENFIQVIQKLSEEKTTWSNQKQMSSQEYQSQKYNQIQQYFQQIRVRQVVDKPRNVGNSVGGSKINQQKQIQIYLALSKKDYRPVEVTKISKKYNNYKKIQQILNSFDALRQLSFSSYFQKYYGYADSLMESTHHYYFSQVIEGVSLKQLLLNKTDYHLIQDTPIFLFWCREIFFALNDLFYKTTYMPILPINLDNIYVNQSGIQVKLKGIRFNRVRKQHDNLQLLQAKLLRNFALICLHILGLQEQQVQKIAKVNLKLLFKAMLRSQFQQVRFDQGSSAKRISFGLCKNYSLLTGQFVIDASGDIIMKNYQDVFKKLS